MPELFIAIYPWSAPRVGDVLWLPCIPVIPELYRPLLSFDWILILILKSADSLERGKHSRNFPILKNLFGISFSSLLSNLEMSPIFDLTSVLYFGRERGVRESNSTWDSFLTPLIFGRFRSSCGLSSENTDWKPFGFVAWTYAKMSDFSTSNKQRTMSLINGFFTSVSTLLSTVNYGGPLISISQGLRCESISISTPYNSKQFLEV